LTCDAFLFQLPSDWPASFVLLLAHRDKSLVGGDRLLSLTLASRLLIDRQHHMKRRLIIVLVVFALLVVADKTHAAENSYQFTVTGQGGEALGSGKIRLPFKLGADGKGNADWQFTPTQAITTNKYWANAKGRLASGKGKANAECKDSWLTLDFNPGWMDNNVTVSWALREAESGTLHFADFSGGHPCASFRILLPARPTAAPDGGSAGPAANSEPSRLERRR
jgi:hypothetical protein